MLDARLGKAVAAEHNMSGSSTTTTPAPTFIRTDYFIYTKDGHRDPTQVWNVKAGGKDLQIHIQGSVSGFPTITETHFAKKHLLTFAGGKADTAGGKIADKMQRIADKRARTGLTSSQKKDLSKIGDSAQEAYWEKINHKYAGSVTKKNTFIKVDAMAPDELRKLIAEALVAGNGTEAEVEFPADAVWYLEIGGTAKQLQDNGHVKLGLGYEKSGDTKFVIKHLETHV